MAAGESGEFFSVREGITADDRPVGGDGLQTFGGVRALARYVKIEAVPASGGSVGINEASLFWTRNVATITDPNSDDLQVGKGISVYRRYNRNDLYDLYGGQLVGLTPNKSPALFTTGT